MARGRSGAPSSRAGLWWSAVSRPTRFEHFRWLGDKRSLRVHDLDAAIEACAIDELLQAETFATFGPDSLPEAKNRGYKPCRHCVPHRAESAA